MVGRARIRVHTLSDLRRDRGIQQQQLAQKIGISPSTLCEHEQSNNPPVETIRRAVRAMGGDIAILALFPDGRRYQVVVPGEPGILVLKDPPKAKRKTSRTAKASPEART